MTPTQLTDLATRYAAAWSGQNPDALASYTEDGSLTVNNGSPSVGRAAIAATASGFMTAFPDMVVEDGSGHSGRRPHEISLDVDRDQHRPRRHRESGSPDWL